MPMIVIREFFKTVRFLWNSIKHVFHTFLYPAIWLKLSIILYCSRLFNVYTSTLYTLRLDFHFLCFKVFLFLFFCVSPNSPYWKRTVAQSTLSDIFTTIGELRSPILRRESNPEPTVLRHTPGVESVSKYAFVLCFCIYSNAFPLLHFSTTLFSKSVFYKPWKFNQIKREDVRLQRPSAQLAVNSASVNSFHCHLFHFLFSARPEAVALLLNALKHSEIKIQLAFSFNWNSSGAFCQ